MTCEDPERYVIRTLREGHCARGPARCARCREAEARPARACLLDTRPERADEQARPTIQVRPGEWRPYDVVRVFATRAEAEDHARAHGLDADLDGA